MGISGSPQELEGLKPFPKSLLYSMMIEPNVIDFALTSLELFAKHLKKEKYNSLNLLFITETITLFWGFEMIILY